MVFLPRFFIAHDYTSTQPHPHHYQRQELRLFFGAVIFWSAFIVPALAQVDLKSSPLTVPKNKSNQGLFSKWTEMSPRQKGNDSLIDYKLGAIFRGVAYGVSTISPSSGEKEQEMVRGEEHHEDHEIHKISEVAHMPDMNFVSASPEDTTSNLSKHINTTGDHKLHRNNYTRQNDYEDELLVTQISTSHVNVQESVGRPVGESRIFGNVNKDMIDTASKGHENDYTTHEMVRPNVGPWGEPTPDWILAREAWGVAWEVHVYTVATLYSLLALFSLYCLARIYVSGHLLPRGYCVTIHLLLFLATFFRSVYLFHDPYSCEGKLPTSLSYVLFNTGAPCLFGALAVLILALLRATRTHLLPPILQTPLALATIVAFHLGLSIAVDVIVGVMGIRTVPLHVVVQAVTAVWGAALCVGYVWVFSHVERVAVRQQEELVRMTFTRVHLEGGTVPSCLPRPSLSRGGRLTLAATVTGLLLVGLQAYGMVTLQGLWAHHAPQPWPWYGYHSASRLLEILMWILIGVASALPSGTSQGKQRKKGSNSGSGKKEMRLLSIFCKSCADETEDSWNGNFSGKRQLGNMYPTICRTDQAIHHFTPQTHTKVVYEDTSTIQRVLPQWRVNTGTMLANKKHSVCKSATLHTRTSDMHLLGNQSCDGAPSNSSPHPSSTLFNKSGLVRFRTQVDPQENMGEVFRKSSQDLDKLCDDKENPKKTPAKIPKAREFVHERNKQNTAHRPLKKSQKNVNNTNSHNDLYGSGQCEHLLQNGINSELYSSAQKDSPASCQSEVSTTDYSFTNVLSPNNDSECSKYESTCSSISAANSFDVRMYEDYEVASYYPYPSFVPSSGSSNLYSLLHKPSGPRAKILQQQTTFAEEVAGVLNTNGDHGLAPHAMEQPITLLSPQACVVSVSPQSTLNLDNLTDVSVSHGGFQENAPPPFQGSGSDEWPHVRYHYDEGTDDNRSLTAFSALTTPPQTSTKLPVLQPGTPSRQPLHFDLHHSITPGSVAVMSSGHTEGGDLQSGGEDNGVSDLDILKINSSFFNNIKKTQSKDELLSELVRKNFSLHDYSYSSLSIEDMGVPSEEGTSMVTQSSVPFELGENERKNTSPPVRPCGHRPRRRQGRGQNSSHHHSKRQQQSSSTTSTAAGPPISSNSTSKPISVTSVHSSASRTTLSMSDGATQTESQIQPSRSLDSSRPNSSLASQSDLHSECVKFDNINNSSDIQNPSTGKEEMKRIHKGENSTFEMTHEETRL